MTAVIPIRRPITTRYRVNRPLLTLARRVRRAWRRNLRAQQLADRFPMRSSVSALFWPGVIGSGLLLGLAIAVLTRGQYVGWDGLHNIPTEAAR